jgi:predicted O-methyltransferase YrrM
MTRPAARARRSIGAYREQHVLRRSDPRFARALEPAVEIEGFTSAAELSLLYHLALLGPGPGDVVEIGSYLGRSTVVLARALADAGSGTLVAVDPHTSALGFGDERATDREFLENVERTGVAERVQMLKMTSVEAAHGWRGGPVRMLFVDGWHSYAAVIDDVIAWRGHLTADATVVFDDYPHPGVRAAVAKLIADRVITGRQLIVGKMTALAPRSLVAGVPYPPGAVALARLGRLGYAIAFRGKVPNLDGYYAADDQAIPDD